MTPPKKKTKRTSYVEAPPSEAPPQANFVPDSQPIDQGEVQSVEDEAVTCVPDTQSVCSNNSGEQDILAATECQDMNTLFSLMSEVVSTQEFCPAPPSSASSVRHASPSYYSRKDVDEILGNISSLHYRVQKNVLTQKKQNGKHLVLSANRFKDKPDAFEVFKLCDAKRQCSTVINSFSKFVPILRSVVNKGRTSSDMYLLRDNLKNDFVKMCQNVADFVKIRKQ